MGNALNKILKIKYPETQGVFPDSVLYGLSLSQFAIKKVESVSIDSGSVNLALGGTITLIATVLPLDATDKTVIWSSSNQTVATVIDGVITALSAGSTTITVTTIDGNMTATCIATIEVPYQQWSKYPQSPLLTSDFPYQMIIEDGFDDNANGTKAGVTLYLVKQKFYVYSAYGYSDVHQPSVMQWHEYVLTDGAWVLRRSDTTTWVGNTFFPAAITQQNCDVYTDATLTNIRYPKSTS